MIKILHIVSIDTTISNGPRFSVPALCEALNYIDEVNSCLYNITPELDSLNELNKYSFEEIKELNTEYISQFNLVIFHSFWYVKFIKIAKELRRLDIPYIIYPRGAFTKKALARKWFKKALARKVFFNKFVKYAKAIVYLTDNEKKESKNNFIVNNNYIIPNGVNIKGLSTDICVNTKNIIFMGRLDPYTKGLDILLDAILLIKDKIRSNGFVFNFYGSDFPIGGKYKLITKINKYKINDIVNLNDPVYGNDKENILRRAGYFIAPSRFEGLPMAILDALSYGVPVFLTKETNLLDVVQLYRCGYELKLEAQNISKVLSEVIFNRYDYAIRSRSISLVENEFSWSKIAKNSIEIYSDVINSR
ncbi:glycosyltransferase [Francisella tularensis]|uniref:glycosyltransferase n=1 Tax=Francisella tularensis TaxID=263 RepID=UPI001C0EA2DE|nr:glycosyltransferase [Francisella tularensis]MBK2110034.1 glycosyltransferase [Francisella tularensis subsp. novicida FSC595]